MKLEAIEIKKFKRIKSIHLSLADINILVGTNGSGKSSVLQALHLASCLMRQAKRIRPSGTAIVKVSKLDYLPSDEYWRLGHDGDWGNRKKSPSSEVLFKFRNDDNTKVTAKLEMRSARNAGISVSGELPEGVRAQFRKDRGNEVYFSSFIPGISGIQNVEQKNSKRVVLKACSFGNSNVYLRNALNLLSKEDLISIEKWLKPLLGDIKLDVRFNEEKDLNIEAEVEIDNRTIPLELLGTGYLQLIQIFCYILLFKPKILLVDEPDIHLHPSVQEKLANSLSQIAREKGIKIIMSTHSPFIVRGASADANVVWLTDGQKETDDRAVVEHALGWGAFGKKIIVISEDKKTDLLKKLIRQWPEIDQAVAVLPGRGYNNLPTEEQVRELRDTLGGKFKVLVHRDRDSLTDEEVAILEARYSDDGISLWLTDQSDIEAEFCSPGFLSKLTGEPENICQTWVSDILKKYRTLFREMFDKQRRAHNKEVYLEGGSPINDDVWDEFKERPLKGASGKEVFKKLKNTVPKGAFTERTVNALTDYPECATSLKAKLKELLA